MLLHLSSRSSVSSDRYNTLEDYMRVFRIEVKFEDGKSSLPANFKGFVALKKSGTIRGYVEEKMPDNHIAMRYIYGQYDEEHNRLAFFKLSSEKDYELPFLYVFPSLNESGDELQYTPLFDFFPFETITRHVRVTISEETTVKFDKIIAKYNKVIEDKNKLNIMLIRDGVEDYIHKV